MATIFREDEGDLSLFQGSTLAVLGYGNQGHAHAQNLRDALEPGTARVLVGARRGGRSWARAREDGFSPRPYREAVAEADHVVVLLPDEVQGRCLGEEVLPFLAPGATLVFGHGFSVAFRTFAVPRDRDVILVAPKAQGHHLREGFLSGRGVASLLAVETDVSGLAWEKARAYARAAGCLRGGGLATSFREEAVTDMFGEQAVLCGGVPALLVKSFDVLVEKGYQPEIAYLECLHELKIIVDLLHEGGLRYMRGLISPTAAWGGLSRGGRIIGEETRKALELILSEIESGRFTSEWLEEDAAGRPEFRARLDREAAHPIEEVGRVVRGLMPWLEADKKGSDHE